MALNDTRPNAAEALRAGGLALIYPGHKGRTSSLGDRPPIRRYTSANLPSRLPNGPPHSTQITCTCLCVGAASTRSTTYSAAQFGHRNGFRIDGWLELPERKRDNQHRHCTKHNHPARIHKLALHGLHASTSKKGRRRSTSGSENWETGHAKPGQHNRMSRRWPKGSSATLAGAPRRPCAGSGDGVLITPLAPADPRHDARP